MYGLSISSNLILLISSTNKYIFICMRYLVIYYINSSFNDLFAFFKCGQILQNLFTYTYGSFIIIYFFYYSNLTTIFFKVSNCSFYTNSSNLLYITILYSTSFYKGKYRSYYFLRSKTTIFFFGAEFPMKYKTYYH